MKTLAINKENKCMTCLTCEIACSEAFYKKYDPALSCIHIGEKDGVTKLSICIQCGKCARSCPHEAITKNDKGVYTLDKAKCQGCGLCVEACPFGVMVKSPDREQPSKCIACGICVKKCPADAIFIKEA